jgi:hypothetical protein
MVLANRGLPQTKTKRRREERQIATSTSPRWSLRVMVLPENTPQVRVAVCPGRKKITSVRKRRRLLETRNLLPPFQRTYISYEKEVVC